MSAADLMMQFPSSQEVAAWLGVIAAAVLTGLGIRLRASKVDTEVRKQGVESNQYERLLKERDAAMADAREAWAMRTRDAEQIARLIAREEALRSELLRLRRDFDSFKRLIVRHFPEAVDFFPSGAGELGLPEDRQFPS